MPHCFVFIASLSFISFKVKKSFLFTKTFLSQFGHATVVREKLRVTERNKMRAQEISLTDKISAGLYSILQRVFKCGILEEIF